MLFRSLDRYALGQYSIKGCVLKRSGENLDLAGRAANLNAECTLDWWTINLSGERGLTL